MRLAPLFSGGGQERGLRSGTLPAPLIVGLGEAAPPGRGRDGRGGRRASPTCATGCWRGCAAALPGIVVNGSMTARIPGNLNLTFPAASAADADGAVAGSVRLHRLGLLLGRGRAVLRAARARPVATTAAARTLRIGIGRFTSPADIDFAAAALAAAHAGAGDAADAEA